MVHSRNFPSSRSYRGLIDELFRNNPGAKVLNLGSRSKKKKNFTYLDIEDKGSADIIADAADMPIKSDTFDLVINTAVMQHVKEPQKVAAECFRVLKPGGKIFVSVPFLYGYHEDPVDMQRYSHTGVINLFKEFRCLKCGVEHGPAAAITVMLKNFFAILFSFNSKMLFIFFKGMFGYVFFPIKFLDYLLIKNKFSYMAPYSIYFIGVKDKKKK